MAIKKWSKEIYEEEPDEKNMAAEDKYLYTEDECNEFRKKIRAYQIKKGYITENNKVGCSNFRKLDKRYYEEEDGIYKYSYPKKSPKKLWKPEEITKEHTNLCNIKDSKKIHNTRIIERRPTYIQLDDGKKELRFKIFYYNGVEEIDI